MKIKDRLTLLFSVIVASIVLLFSCMTYVLYADYRNDEFYKRLKDKAQTTARLLAQVQEVDKELLQIIDKNTINQLYKEKIIIFDKDNDLIYSSLDDEVITIDQRLLDEVRHKGYMEYLERENEVIGLHYTAQGTDYVVVASAFDKYGKRKLESLKYFLVFSSLVSIVLTVIAGMFFSRRAIAPISAINQQVSNISIDNLSLRVQTENSKDEIDQLAQNFNRMLDRIEHALKTQKSFIDNASHELRTPLAAINSQLEVALSQDRSNPEYTRIMRSVQEDARKMTNLVNTLLVLAKSQEEQDKVIEEPLRIDELVLSVQDELHGVNPGYTIEFSYDAVPERELDMTILGNEWLLRSAFMNLLENACKFSADHKARVSVSCDQQTISVSIADRGIGIPPEDLSRIFDPFYRSENGRAQKGFGIGLSICKRVIDLHKGKILVRSELGEGSTFVLTFNHL